MFQVPTFISVDWAAYNEASEYNGGTASIYRRTWQNVASIIDYVTFTR